ncbi:TraR/DksA family transcriptional regulator [Leptospirillum ferriphilum]|uniref:Putative dnaK suppressor n=2 Tax=Leptospirillum TaxID=179 RepID=A0A094X2I6_9BACT|nr:TraR/DksA C4-type zinc finger protein [Leptospirillum ferriphilum]EDZ39307.1 MAG: putative transcriptional regulator, TraR/DksA family [Leptospirillum sp. Group II '5-way CG']KGA92779.1 putative dnaK suppressor [Leptospirillum ferriphilum]MDA8150791.1 TraR/DksA C4-type zinc finger protein [Nitrospiraceae bacterium]
MVKGEERNQRLREILLSKQTEVERDIRQHLARQIGPENEHRLDSALDQGDLSSIDMGEGVDLALLEMRNKTRKAIHQALQRLGEGTYGYCEECGGEIEEKRLKVMPFAQLCIVCQRKKEELEKIEKEESIRDADSA